MEFKGNRPNVVLVVDCSGSMSGYISQMTNQLKALEHKVENNEINTNLAIVAFDDSVDDIHWDGAWSLHRGGGTNLYGACIRTIRSLIDLDLTTKDKVMIVVITDGQHGGGSDRFTGADVKSEVLMAEEVMGWDFLFVGTNQNAYQAGNHLGIKPGKALSFANNKNGFDLMLQSIGDIAKRWSAGYVAHDAEFFTQEVKDQQSRLGAIVLN